MLKTYDTIKSILGEQAAKDIIKILVNEFNFYITSEEIQQINIIF